MHGMATHLNHAAHGRSAYAQRTAAPCAAFRLRFRGRACYLRARAYYQLPRDRYQLAGLLLASMSLHVLCMCCACVVHVLCCAVLCYAVHVHVLCCACACAMHVLCMCCACMCCDILCMCCAVPCMCCAVHALFMCVCYARAACVPCACACAMHVLHVISLETVALKNASVSANASCSRMTPSTSPYIRKQYVPLYVYVDVVGRVLRGPRQ